MTRRGAVAAGAVSLALALGSCGGDPEEDVRDTVSGYFSALSQNDAAGACERLAPTLAPEIAAVARERFPQLRDSGCTPVLRRVLADAPAQQRGALAQVEIVEVTVDGDEAEVRLAGADQMLALTRADGGWRIDELSFSAASESADAPGSTTTSPD